jgi:hypothetical protein
MCVCNWSHPQRSVRMIVMKKVAEKVFESKMQDITNEITAPTPSRLWRRAAEDTLFSHKRMARYLFPKIQDNRVESAKLKRNTYFSQNNLLRSRGLINWRISIQVTTGMENVKKLEHTGNHKKGKKRIAPTLLFILILWRFR